MDPHRLADIASRGAQAYVSNLAAAEEMVRRGQFNAAKVLRALAHTQRSLALSAARELAREVDPVDLLEHNIAQLETAGDDRVAARARDVAVRAAGSLAERHDVPEDVVAQRMWGCYGCGWLIEGEQRDACPNCGALAVEFESFGPFFAHTPEHLGQRSPQDLVTELRRAPAELADALAGWSEAELAARPAADEWSAKELVGHLIETDLLFVRRASTLLAERGVPVLDPSAPWTLHENKGYQDMAAVDLIALHRDARNASLMLVSDLSEEDWSRLGNLRGTTNSMLDLGSWLANHDTGHIAQLRRAR